MIQPHFIDLVIFCCRYPQTPHFAASSVYIKHNITILIDYITASMPSDNITHFPAMSTDKGNDKEDIFNDYIYYYEDLDKFQQTLLTRQYTSVIILIIGTIFNFFRLWQSLVGNH